MVDNLWKFAVWVSPSPKNIVHIRRIPFIVVIVAIVMVIMMGFVFWLFEVLIIIFVE